MVKVLNAAIACLAVLSIFNDMCLAHVAKIFIGVDIKLISVDIGLSF